MKKLMTWGLALVLAAGSAAPLAAQRDTAQAGARGRPPFDRLLRHRAELQLSDAQVRQLQAIRERLDAQNAPLRQQLTAQSQRFRTERRQQLERMSPQERRAELRRLRQQRAAERVPADMQPVVRQMRVNIEEAMHQAQGVLTAEQRLRAREILRREVRTVRESRVRGERRLRRPAAEGRRPRDQRQP